MVKKITNLTPEQETRIPVFIKKWVDTASQPVDRKIAFKRLKNIFKDNLIFFGESFKNTLDLIQLIREICAVTITEYDSQLDSQLGSQLGSQLYSQLGSQLDSQLGSQLYSQLDSQLGSQLYSQLRSQLDSQLRSQLDSQLYNQLDSQLGSQLGSQLYSQLDSQLGSQLDSQLGSQLYSQLRSQLDSQLDSQLGKKAVKWSYYISYFWSVWAGMYDFAQFIGVDFPDNILTEFFDLVTHAPLCIFIGKLVFVCEKPTISWGNERLHSENGLAVKWSDKSGFHYLDGQYIEPEIYPAIVSGKMPFAEIMRIENADIRAIALKYNPLSMLDAGARLIDKSERNNELYLIENNSLNDFLDEPKIWMLKMTCPTGRVFVEGVEPSFAEKYPKADSCQAYALGISPNQYRNLAVEG